MRTAFSGSAANAGTATGIAATLRVALVLPLVAVLTASRQADATGPLWQFAGGDARRGPALIQQYGCAGCHTVPGVDNAHGNVGPPLSRFADRTYIAGVLRNTPDNLIKWLRKPQSVVPGNAMPDMAVTEQDARDIGAYLYTLR